MKIVADIDLDLADRKQLLEHLPHIPASKKSSSGELEKHVVGIYLHEIPVDPVTGLSSIEYNEAKDRGYFKLDLLNVRAYGLDKIRNEDHLSHLMETEPVWQLLEDEDIVNQLFQLNGHFDVVFRMKPCSVEQLAMTLALIRPAKRYLIGRSWPAIEREIWDKPKNDSYYFKKSHSIGYALAIVVQLNLMVEEALDN